MVQMNHMAGKTKKWPYVGRCLLRIDLPHWLVGIDAKLRVEWTGRGWRVRTMACVATTSSW